MPCSSTRCPGRPPYVLFPLTVPPPPPPRPAERTGGAEHSTAPGPVSHAAPRSSPAAPPHPETLRSNGPGPRHQSPSPPPPPPNACTDLRSLRAARGRRSLVRGPQGPIGTAVPQQCPCAQHNIAGAEGEGHTPPRRPLGPRGHHQTPPDGRVDPHAPRSAPPQRRRGGGGGAGPMGHRPTLHPNGPCPGAHGRPGGPPPKVHVRPPIPPAVHRAKSTSAGSRSDMRIAARACGGRGSGRGPQPHKPHKPHKPHRTDMSPPTVPRCIWGPGYGGAFISAPALRARG